MRIWLRTFLAKRGYYKLPPRYAWKVLAETPLRDLTKYGRDKLGTAKTMRAKVVEFWALYDELTKAKR